MLFVEYIDYKVCGGSSAYGFDLRVDYVAKGRVCASSRVCRVNKD